MVRIVSDGPDPSVKYVICPNCRAVLEYTTNDIKQKHYNMINWGFGTAYWITCPKCNKDIAVRTS